MTESLLRLDRARAEKLQPHFTHLRGKPFGLQSVENDLQVHDVILIPGNGLHQVMFIKEYESCRSIDKALAIQEWIFFDLAVLTHVTANPFTARIKGLKRYLSEMQMENELFILSSYY